jgi:hypothetical protein
MSITGVASIASIGPTRNLPLLTCLTVTNGKTRGIRAVRCPGRALGQLASLIGKPALGLAALHEL